MVLAGHVWDSNVSRYYVAWLHGSPNDISGNRIDRTCALPDRLVSLETKDGELILLEIICCSSHQVIDSVDQVPVFAICLILHTPPQFQEAGSYISNLF